MDPEFMAILEVCGFNDWLIEELRRCKCQEVVLTHPEKPSKLLVSGQVDYAGDVTAQFEPAEPYEFIK